MDFPSVTLRLSCELGTPIASSTDLTKAQGKAFLLTYRGHLPKEEYMKYMMIRMPEALDEEEALIKIAHEKPDSLDPYKHTHVLVRTMTRSSLSDRRRWIFVSDDSPRSPIKPRICILDREDEIELALYLFSADDPEHRRYREKYEHHRPLLYAEMGMTTDLINPCKTQHEQLTPQREIGDKLPLLKVAEQYLCKASEKTRWMVDNQRLLVTWVNVSFDSIQLEGFIRAQAKMEDIRIYIAREIQEDGSMYTHAAVDFLKSCQPKERRPDIFAFEGCVPMIGIIRDIQAWSIISAFMGKRSKNLYPHTGTFNAAKRWNTRSES